MSAWRREPRAVREPAVDDRGSHRMETAGTRTRMIVSASVGLGEVSIDADTTKQRRPGGTGRHQQEMREL